MNVQILDSVLATPAGASCSTTVTPVILSGGSGSRLWPVSRASFPKQFWPLISDRSLIEETARRGIGPGFTTPVVVCNQEHRFLIAEQMRLAGVTGARILLEPLARNSAPAVAVAAFLAAETDPDAMLWIMAADAVITDLAAQYVALDRAVPVARDGRIVAIGMYPSAPETAYSYLEVGMPLSGHHGVHELASFMEKPDPAIAVALACSGRHLWNSGMFVATAATLLSEFERHAPEVFDAARRAFAGRARDLDFIRLDERAFTSSPEISLEHVVLGRTECVAVVPADLGWSDIGSWGSLWDIGVKDADGNVTSGDVLLENSRDCYVRSDGILTAVVGLSDAVVVVTEDAVLAIDRTQAQDVKMIVDRLRKVGRKEAVSHNRVYRPWGFYESLIRSDRFQVKRIVVKPNQKLSLQMHYHRSEHWVVVAGSAIVTRDEETILVHENESIYLPLGCIHRLDNPGRIPLTLIEVQSGSYLGEDDIVRLEDTYGRS